MISDAELDLFVAWLKKYLETNAGNNAFHKAALPRRLKMIEELQRRAQLTSKGVQMEIPLDGY